jgi:acyl-CoA thioester hydrolase
MTNLSAYNITCSAFARGADVDASGQVHTSGYIRLFDTAINRWLAEETEYDTHHARVIGVLAHYDVEYHRGIRFTEALTVGLRVNSIGKTSVTYDAALFGTHDLDGEPPRLAASARWVHVYIDRISRRPDAMPSTLRTFLQAMAGK